MTHSLLAEPHHDGSELYVPVPPRALGDHVTVRLRVPLGLGVDGQGRGGALVAAAERLAEQRGIDDLYLLTTTAPGFFALHDYLRVQRASAPLALQGTSQFASLCPSTAVCMHKRLRRPRL